MVAGAAGVGATGATAPIRRFGRERQYQLAWRPPFDIGQTLLKGASGGALPW